MPDLKNRILEDIALTGPMPLPRYMSLCLGDPEAGYYMRRDPFGAEGDFTTAPEISQMFGELIGVWLVSAWKALGSPPRTRLVEFGPGRGTLMADCLRSLALQPALLRGLEVEMIDISPVLKAAQQSTLMHAPCPIHWHDELQDSALPTLIVANEFFDALPVHILVKTADGLAERHIVAGSQGQLAFADLPTSQSVRIAQTEKLPPGTVFELSPQRNDMATAMAKQLSAHGGAALLIDYGFVQPRTGATFQALVRHQPVDPLDQPGQADLTALVDFTALANGFRSQGMHVCGPVSQMDFLLDLGLVQRAAHLGAERDQEARETLQQDVNRLVSPDEMGVLFKVLAASSFEVSLPGFHNPA
uniref:class I SAM-dependent methyltransferase n=1 Tax=Pararhizobium sp. IMCC3301 TaxID=3067904 RepID=UPI002741A0FC|nr:SAM-dependent methyltransferase [Pararhizobium sp. IMCC3301]